MRKSARTQIPPFFDNDPYRGYIVFAFSVIMFDCLFVCLSVCKLFPQIFLSNYLG